MQIDFVVLNCNASMGELIGQDWSYVVFGNVREGDATMLHKPETADH